MGEGGLLARAREAYASRDWVRARDSFTAAWAEAELEPDDLSALASAVWWLGHTDRCLELSERVYRQYLHGAQVPRAAELALTIGVLSMLRGEDTVGSGWISRARRLLADTPESRAHGILLSLDAAATLAGGEYELAAAAARRACEIGHRLADPDTIALGLVTQGIARVRQGRVADGLAMIDEGMLPVRAGEVTPDWAGNLYCQVMQLCHEVGDVRRAREWTELTERWCAGFPSAVMFAGICRMHRVQLHQLDGDWERAEREAGLVCQELATMNRAVVGEAHYLLGELYRLRGDATGAQQAYTRAHEHGRDPQPGWALLRMETEGPAAAATSIRTAVAAAGDPLARARLRQAEVEIACAAGDTVTARAAADDLGEIAQQFATWGIAATASYARGVAHLVGGAAAPALSQLRQACVSWNELGAAYPAARARVLMARACAELGDPDAAAWELDAAIAVFSRLAAVVDLRAAALLRAGLGGGRALPDGLTEREAEVLGLVAGGRSNREIAAALVISEKTVARHVSNIFVKIKVASRTEAAAYAFRNGIVSAT